MDLLLPDNSTNTKKDDDIVTPPEVLSLRIKTNSDSTTHNISTNSDCSVLQLKELVRNKLGPTARGRYLRLICQGRLLAPDRATLSEFQLKQDVVIHAVLAAPGVRGGQQASLSQSTSSSSTNRRRLRGVGIGANGLVVPRNGSNDDSSDGESGDSDLEEGRMGFDRLRNNDRSRSEVAAIRLYFSRQVDRFRDQRNRNRSNSETNSNGSENNTDNNNNANGNSNNNDGTNDTAAESRRERLRLEDEWMSTQGPTSEFRLNLNTNNPLMASRVFGSAADFSNYTSQSTLGTDRDLWWGFVLGFFMGVVMMFWVWMPTVPHKQKLGILAGICAQMTLNLLRKNSFEDSAD